MLYQNRYYKNEKKLKYSKSILSLGRITFWGQDSWTKYYIFSKKEQARTHARTHSCTHDIVKMQLTHDSTFCRGRGYETKSPHLQGTLK